MTEETKQPYPSGEETFIVQTGEGKTIEAIRRRNAVNWQQHQRGSINWQSTKQNLYHSVDIIPRN